MNWFMVEDQFPVFLTEILTVGFAISVFSISTSGGTGICTSSLQFKQVEKGRNSSQDAKGLHRELVAMCYCGWQKRQMCAGRRHVQACRYGERPGFARRFNEGSALLLDTVDHTSK